MTPAPLQTLAEIPISKIEVELNRLAGSQKNQIKACLFNLVIFCHEPRRAAYLYQIVQSITDKFPCRIIFIQTIQQTVESFLKVSVGHVSVGQGDTSVACDQINIDVTKDQLARVPFIVLPHLVPDLPVFLVWGQNPTTETIILPHLQKNAARLIFDSECAEDLASFSQNLLKMSENNKLEIRDVKWAALGGWREVIKTTFHHPDKIAQLKNARCLNITYNGLKSIFTSHTEILAIYIQAWLAAQLEWSYCSFTTQAENRQFIYHTGHHEVEVNLIPQNSKFAGGAIMAITMESELFSASMKRLENQAQIAIDFASQAECSVPFNLPLAELQTSANFMAEIFYRQTSLHYNHMLAMIARYGKI